MNQYKLIMYVVLSILTGSMGVMFFAINKPDSNLNFKVMGCVLLVSFVGHMISFYDRMKNQ
jgi:hypothetical protein